MKRLLGNFGLIGLACVLAVTQDRVQADPRSAPRQATGGGTESPRPLPPVPKNLPRWLENTKKNHIFYKRGRYNFDVYHLQPLARDLNAVAVGHAMAYEDLVTGKAGQLETRTFNRINRVLKNPPRFMPDEAAISPTFGRKYGVLEQVFDWTHILHAQTVDVLASKKLTMAEKDREIEKLWKYYFESVPYAITPLPMNMEYLDSQPYSTAFRKKYPKVNGLFWGYHWLQGMMYDTLYRVPTADQKTSYEVVGERYHKTELYRTDRPFMPMFGETSPRFAARFPQIANAFDNLHMLHDLVNDILATEWMTEKQKEEQIRRAVWLVSADAHRGEKPGDTSADKVHDHRFFAGMPGMGMMKGMTPELMWMPEMGWMSMQDCHHCSMPLWEGKDAWRNPTVSAEGWTMRVRCALCARDMAAETKGKAILRIPTEDPDRMLVVIGDEQGNLKTSMPEAVFLEREGSHAGCDDWSRAFTSRAAFEAYVKANPKFADAKPLTFEEWSQRQGEKPDTYVKPKGPVENPYVDVKRETRCVLRHSSSVMRQGCSLTNDE
jgi:hypothetical protein